MLASRDVVEARSRRKRRSWTLEEKRRIVDESLEEGASIALVARRHDLNANQLFTWRRQFGVGGFEPRSLFSPMDGSASPTMPQNEPCAASRSAANHGSSPDPIVAAREPLGCTPSSPVAS